MQDGIYAKFNTTKGTITVQLTHDKTPGTVGNFVALSEGQLKNSLHELGSPLLRRFKISSRYSRFYDSRRLPARQRNWRPRLPV